MTLRLKWGEFGEVNPIRCVDSDGNDISIAFADVAQSTIYILTENKTKVLDTITSANFTIATPIVNWTPTKVQSEKHVPGNYAGEIHLQNTGQTRKSIFEFPVFVEKAQGNI